MASIKIKMRKASSKVYADDSQPVVIRVIHKTIVKRKTILKTTAGYIKSLLKSKNLDQATRDILTD